MCILWRTQRAMTTDPLNLLVDNHGCQATSAILSGEDIFLRTRWRVKIGLSISYDHILLKIKKCSAIVCHLQTLGQKYVWKVIGIDIDRVIAPRLWYLWNFPPIYTIGKYNRWWIHISLTLKAEKVEWDIECAPFLWPFLCKQIHKCV